MRQSIRGDRRDIGQINRQLLGLIDKVFAVLMQVKTLNIFLMVQILFAVKRWGLIALIAITLNLFQKGFAWKHSANYRRKVSK